MARGDPCDGRLEGIEQRLFPLPFRFVEAHAERRAHHEPLELRLHDPVRAAGTRQPQLVARLCAPEPRRPRLVACLSPRGCPAVFTPTPPPAVGIITGEYSRR